MGQKTNAFGGIERGFFLNLTVRPCALANTGLKQMNDTTDSTELTKQTDAAANVAVSRVVSVRSGCVPDDRRECLVTVTFSNEVYLAKYNEVTGKWMIAFSNREPISNDNIREWAYVEDVFTPSLGELLDAAGFKPPPGAEDCPSWL